MPGEVRSADLTDMSREGLILEIRRLEDAVAGFESICTQKNIRIKNLESENLELIEGRRVQAKTYDELVAERQKDAEVSAVAYRRLSKLRSAIDEILKLGNSAEALDGWLSQMAADAALSRVQLLAVIRAMLDIAGDCISSDGITKEA